MREIAVFGAGVSGFASAIALARLGFEPTMYRTVGAGCDTVEALNSSALELLSQLIGPDVESRVQSVRVLGFENASLTGQPPLCYRDTGTM